MQASIPELMQDLHQKETVFDIDCPPDVRELARKFSENMPLARFAMERAIMADRASRSKAAEPIKIYVDPHGVLIVGGQDRDRIRVAYEASSPKPANRVAHLYLVPQALSPAEPTP